MTTGTYSRYAAIGLIIDFLDEHEQKRIESQINKIAAKNTAESRHTESDGFLFKGTFYQDTQATTRYREKHVLIPSLWGEMESLQRDAQNIRTENQKTAQGLLLLLKACQNWQDVRDALPEFLVPALKLEPPLERLRPEGWTVEYEPAKKAAYQSIRDTLEVRMATRLIF